MWTHIGEGNLKAKIEKYCSELIPQSNFKFLGQLTNAEVIDYYLSNNIDLFINTSSYEGIPVSIMEAQSFGVPVIATDVGGNTESVRNGIEDAPRPLRRLHAQS